jgi:hypothetical protein
MGDQMVSKRLLSIAWIVGILTPLAVVSTPPEPPLYHAYSIGVNVQSSAGAARENVPVALAARCYGEWRLLRPDAGNNCGYVYPDKGAAVALTNSQGRAGLVVYCSMLLDSMAVAVVLPDTFVMGDLFRRAEQVASYPLEEEYWQEDDGFLCSDSVELRSRDAGTIHEFSSDTLIVD